jgi:hypothetical protein
MGRGVEMMEANRVPMQRVQSRHEEAMKSLETSAFEPDKPGTLLPSDPARRKNIPIARGVLDYFPDAIAAVAEISRLGNEQHNPGEPLHWAKEKSTDHADCIARHLIERGRIDGDGSRHSAKLAWRALALLQIELENERDG